MFNVKMSEHFDNSEKIKSFLEIMTFFEKGFQDKVIGRKLKDLYGVLDEVSVEERRVKEKCEEYKGRQGVCYQGFVMQRNGIK